MRRRVIETVVVVALAVVGLSGVSRPPHARPKPETLHAAVDPSLPSYMAREQLTGSLKGVQSDTTPGLVDLWIKGFKKHQPGIAVEAEIEGSGAAGPALTGGTADFGLIAREMMIKEETPFTKKFGYKPFSVAVAGGSYRTLAFTDAITFFVNQENPLDKLSFAQIEAMYSKTRKRGYPQEITKWGQLGLKGEWADKPVHLWGVQPENGFEHFVAIRVLQDGQWKDGIEGQDTVFPIAPAVAADRYAIGYAGFAYLKPGVKTLAIAEKDGGPFYKGTFKEVAARKYPLSRLIFLYANRPPGEPLDPKLKEFVKYILGREGQQAVVEDGIFLPLPNRVAKQELAKLD